MAVRFDWRDGATEGTWTMPTSFRFALDVDRRRCFVINVEQFLTWKHRILIYVLR